MRRLLATLLTALLLAVALLPARPALAAESLSFRSIRFPSIVQAGETITFQVEAAQVGEAELCCGSLSLKGPGGQTLSLFLQQSSDGMLEAKLPLSPNAPEGTWEISSLVLWDSRATRLALDKNSGFIHSFTVQRGDAPADSKPPVLIHIKMPAEVTAGDIVPVTAMAGDDLSGVDRVIALVRPQGSENPIWQYGLELRPTGKPNELVGYMVADPLTLPNMVQEIASVTLYDKAGNSTVYDHARLTPNTTNLLTAKVKQRELPPGLVTDPYMNLVHPGENGYWNWLALDRQHVVTLLSESASNATAVREKIAAELPQLRGAVDGLRKEIYIDPTTQLKVSPYATTGKWLALDVAIWARVELLTELDRMAGLTRPERKPLTAGAINALYMVANQNELLFPMENNINTLYAQVPAALLNVLAKSPEAVATLKSPSWESFNYGYADLFDRDVLYFSPVFSGSHSYIRWGQNSMMLTINPGQSLNATVSNLFYDIGRHFAQAHISAFDAKDAPERWKEYLELRGAKEYMLDSGTLSSPEGNLGDDFAWTFLPGGLGNQYDGLQSLPHLKAKPEMAKLFREFVAKKLQTAPPVTSLTPTTVLEVGTSSTVLSTVSPFSAATSATANGIRWAVSQRDNLRAVNNKEVAEFSAQVAEVGRLAWFQLQATDSTGRTYSRNFYYYRTPVMLDPYPAATNQSTLALTGTAPSNQRVAVGDTSAIADNMGRFRLAVPLKEGVNDLRLTVSGQTLAAAFKVRYEPAQTPVTLQVTLPGITRENSVWGSVKTEPYAMVVVKAMRFQANANGEGSFFLPMEEGANAVEVAVTTPAGNSASWKGVVVKDTAAGAITLNIPVVTNQKSYTLTGTVKPGSSLTINDGVVPVDAAGAFKQTIALAESTPTTLKLVATDSAGNRTEQTNTITYAPEVPTEATTAKVTLRGKVAPGTSLTYQGQKILVGLDGSFQHEVPLNLGPNSFVLSAALNGQSTGFIQFEVLQPVQVGTPTAMPDGKMTLTGKTLPGYIIAVNDMLVPVQADGTFTATFEKKGAVAIVTVIGEGKTFKVEVPTP